MDGIPKSVLKLLPENWMAAMTSLFNKIMDEEKTSEDWGNIELIPLHK